MQKFKKWLKFVLKLVVSLAFVAWLIFKVNWQEVLFYFEKISVEQSLLYIAVVILGIIISSYKWKILAELKKFKLPLSRAFQLYLAGTFINNFMPSFIGGDTFKAYQLGKENKEYVSAATSVAMDRITGLIGAMLFSVIFAFLNWKVVSKHHILFVIVGIIAALLLALIILLLISKFSFWNKVSGYIPEKILKVLRDLLHYFSEEKSMFKILILSLTFNLVGLAAANYVLFWGLGIKVDLLNYLTVIFLISIISSIPISINNIGIKEWAYVTFFGFFGVASSGVVAVALLSRVIQMIISFAALPTYLKSKK